MLRYFLIGGGFLLLLIVLASLYAFDYSKADKNKILQFILDNPERSSLYWQRNGQVMTSWRPDEMMPLASTVKIIIAIEYAEQAAEGLIQADRMIALSDLDKYFVKNTDGGAHTAWLKFVKDKIVDDKIALREVAKGMIMFSSNANTEWLTDFLGIENVNDRLTKLEVENHGAIYPIVSALFVGKELFPELKGKELEKELRALTDDAYIEACHRIHEILKNDEEKTYRKDVGDLGLDIQRVWSDRLIASTTKEYVGIIQKINSRNYFNADVHQYLDEVMEALMQNPKNQTWLQHAGQKGGSSAFVLTFAIYATDKDGNTTELTYFFDDLNPLTNMVLQKSMNEFNLNIISNEAYGKEAINTLKKE